MQIYIGNTTTVSEIQEKFHTDYPWLRMVFFRKPHSRQEKYPASDEIDPGTTVEKITPFRVHGWLDVSYFRTAAAIEMELSERYGLYVQIFRKSGEQWLQTTGTDIWTLEALNAAGQSAAPLPFSWPDEPIDE